MVFITWTVGTNISIVKEPQGQINILKKLNGEQIIAPELHAAVSERMLPLLYTFS